MNYKNILLVLVVLAISTQVYAKNQDLYCKINPYLKGLVDKANAKGNALDVMTPESVKAIRKARELSANNIIKEIKVKKIEDINIKADGRSLPIKVYTPLSNALAIGGKLPILVFVHGGGWTLGSPTTYDNVTRALANYIPAVVVSVDYRLAPETPYPAALQDVTLVLSWLSTNASKINGDSSRIAIAGDSGGGNLATVAVIKSLTNKNIHIVQETLFYPSVDIANTNTASYKKFGSGYILTKKSVELFRSFYLPNKKDWNSIDVSPLQAKNLKNMPTTLIITAGCDPLRDEGYSYGQKLSGSGVKVTYINEEQMIHAFLNYYNYDKVLTPIIDEIIKKIS